MLNARNTCLVTAPPQSEIRRSHADNRVPMAMISDRDYAMIASLVERLLGIKTNRAKKPMVASRLLRRLRSLGLSDYAKYCDYLRTPDGAASERGHLLDLITTHKTDFFREPGHFEFLKEHVVPALTGGPAWPAPLRVWSAGCSTGQEAHTLAMVLATEMESAASSLCGFSVLGTDVSPTCVEKAEVAIYSEEEIDGIPEEFRERFLLRSRSSVDRKFRIAPGLRGCTSFRTLNFMDPHWGVETMDIVFCRNVLIYFSSETQRTILSSVCDRLKPGGYLFISHCEALPSADLPLTPVGASVFRRL